MIRPGARLAGRVPVTAARGHARASRERNALASLPLAVVVAASLAGPGCTDAGPTPTIVSVTPPAAYSDLDTPILVHASLLRAGLVVDVSGENARFDDSTIGMALVGDDPGLPAAVRLGPVQTIEDVPDMFLTTVPAGLPAGAYGLRVTPPNGHAVTLHGAFRGLGPDTAGPVVTVDAPAAGSTLGVAEGKAATPFNASLHVDDGFGGLLSVTWSTSNHVSGTCPLTPQQYTGAPPSRTACNAPFTIAPMGPDTPPGLPFTFHVDAVDIAGLATSLDVPLVLATVPVIQSFEPTYGPPSGQQQITIHGRHFSDDAEAFIGPTPITGAPPGNRVGGDVRDAGTIVGFTPWAARAYDATVSVTTVAGVGDGPYPFHYTAAPRIRLVQPASGPPSGGVRMTIAGDDLLSGVVISFGPAFAGSVPLYNATYSFNDKVVGCLPPGQQGTVTVWASDPVTGVGSLMGGFTYADGDDTAPSGDCLTAAAP